MWSLPLESYQRIPRLEVVDGGNEMNNPEVVFDPRLGLQGGSRCRDSRTGKFAPDPNKKRKPKEIMFRCCFCGELKPLEGSRMITRFFPPLAACKACFDREV